MPEITGKPLRITIACAASFALATTIPACQDNNSSDNMNNRGSGSALDGDVGRPARFQNNNTTTANQRTTNPSTNQRPANQRPANQEPAQGLNNLDLGDDWATGSQRQNANPVVSANDRPTEPTIVTRGEWGILLKTFSADNHFHAARTMTEQLTRVDPALRGAYVASRDSGSMVMWGKYISPSDASAASDLKWIKSIKIQGRPVFPGARLAKSVEDNAAAQRFQPGSLLKARADNPNVDPLYTIEVAVWISNEVDKQSFAQMQRAAEAYAAELRARNFQAYFYHDPAQGVCSVTVGLFNHRAINTKTNEVTGTARDIMLQFPHRLNNGQPLDVFIDPNNPSLGTYKQRPELVLVPKL